MPTSTGLPKITPAQQKELLAAGFFHPGRYRAQKVRVAENLCAAGLFARHGDGTYSLTTSGLDLFTRTRTQQLIEGANEQADQAGAEEAQVTTTKPGFEWPFPVSYHRW